MRLLSEPTTNAKLAKSLKKGYLTFGLSLAPSNESGYNTCPHASRGCRKSCIFTSGLGRMPSVIESRIRKTRFLFEEPTRFFAQLRKEVSAAVRKSARLGMKPAFRLNVFSDIKWEESGIIEDFADVQWYDYTKNPSRMMGFCNNAMPDNYHLTFSRSESNQKHVERIVQAGGNVAIVFADKLPETFMGRQVIDGEEHDLRFLDPESCIVGLKAKGYGKTDETGFVINSNQ